MALPSDGGMRKNRILEYKKNKGSDNMNENKTNINWYPGYIKNNSVDDKKFKAFLIKVRKELDIIAERQKQLVEEKSRILEISSKPSTVTRLKVMKKDFSNKKK